MKRLAWGLWLGGVALFVAAFVIGVRGTSGTTGDSLAVAVSQGSAFAAIGAVGLLLATRRPSNPIGWIYLVAWAVMATDVFVGEYGSWASSTDPERLGATLAVWLMNWLWVPIVGLLLTYPFLLFPDGHLPSARWRWIGWAAGGVTVLWCVAFAFEGADYTDASGESAANPYTPSSIVAVFDVSRNVLAIVFLVVVLASVGSLVVRFRRGRSDERAQIKWLILAGVTSAAFLALPVDHGNGNWVDVVFGLVLALLPISVGVAILRYHLYDIDRIISRTTSYALVTAVLLAVYAVVVTSVSRLLPQTSSSFAVAAATLAAAAAFTPVLARVRAVVDRRFDRARYDGQRTAEAFAGRLRNEVDADLVAIDLLGVVHETIHPAGATIWLRGGLP